MKQTLKDMYLKNSRVILRCDFNVPIKDGHVIDETKIIKSLDTINYLLKENCKIIILSHLGRVKTEEDKVKYTLKPIQNILEKLLNMPIKFASDIKSLETKDMVLNLQPREILLLENTRFLDVPDNLESTLNIQMAEYIASFGDVFVNDAFAVSHRNHTTVVGIPKFLPSCIGFLVEKEISLLDGIIKNPNHPFTVIMGGAKVDDKLSVIKSLLPKCDKLLLSGGLANSFLAVLGLQTGASLKSNNPEILNELRSLLLEYKEKFALPLDAVIEETYNKTPKIKFINTISDDDVIKDIGTYTIKKYTNIINESNTVFLNGTIGVYEEEAYKNGTVEIFNVLANTKATVLLGGGDTISAVNSLGFTAKFPNISSGGGATLEYIANGSLPGIDIISDGDDIEILDL